MNIATALSRYVLISACLSLANTSLAGAAAPKIDRTPASSDLRQLWAPVADEVYLQEVGEKVATDKPATAVALRGETAFAVVGGALKMLRDSVLLDAEGAPGGVKRLRSLDRALWAVAEQGTYRYAGKSWERVDERPFVDLCLHLGKVYGATRDDLFRFEDGKFVNIRPASGYLSSDTTVVKEDFSQVLADPVEIGPVERIASYSGTLYLLRPGNLALLDGKTFVPDTADWGALPSPVTRDLLALGSRLYVATDRGVAVLRGMALTSLRGPEGLPYEDTTCLAAGFDGDVWIGTSRGAIRKTESEFHYFGAQHWLPGDYVRDIAVGDHVVYIATDGGLGIIRYEPYTLLKKAAYFESELETWGFKRLGFVHKLYRSGDKDGWLREISDNDGGNTAHYLAAMTFKYAATGDEKARAGGRRSVQGHGLAGRYHAQARFHRARHLVGQGRQGAAVHARFRRVAGQMVSDGGRALVLERRHVERRSQRAHVCCQPVSRSRSQRAGEGARRQTRCEHRLAHRRQRLGVARHGWQAHPLGPLGPRLLAAPLWDSSRGLNGMEAQTYMHTAFALTGDAKFQAGLEQLLKWRYHTYTVRQKLTFPPEEVVPWDDELAFCCYHPLLRYAKDPELRSIYLRSLERHWEVMRMQQMPFFNFIYGALTGNDCEAPQGVQHLREWSLDLVNHSYHNSHRSDLAPRPGYVPYAGGTRAISPRESCAKWGSRSALEYDGGSGGQSVTPPIGWLEDYWMGRYYGFIEPPRTQDPELTTVRPRALARKGAARYDGPSRPTSAWEK